MKADMETERLLPDDDRLAATLELGSSPPDGELETSRALPPWFHRHRDWRRRGDSEVDDSPQPNTAVGPSSDRDGGRVIVGSVGRRVNFDEEGVARRSVKYPGGRQAPGQRVRFTGVPSINSSIFPSSQGQEDGTEQHGDLDDLDDLDDTDDKDDLRGQAILPPRQAEHTVATMSLASATDAQHPWTLPPPPHPMDLSRGPADHPPPDSLSRDDAETRPPTRLNRPFIVEPVSPRYQRDQSDEAKVPRRPAAIVRRQANADLVGVTAQPTSRHARFAMTDTGHRGTGHREIGHREMAREEERRALISHREQPAATRATRTALSQHQQPDRARHHQQQQQQQQQQQRHVSWQRPGEQARSSKDTDQLAMNKRYVRQERRARQIEQQQQQQFDSNHERRRSREQRRQQATRAIDQPENTLRGEPQRQPRSPKGNSNVAGLHSVERRTTPDRQTSRRNDPSEDRRASRHRRPADESEHGRRDDEMEQLRRELEAEKRRQIDIERQIIARRDERRSRRSGPELAAAQRRTAPTDVFHEQGPIGGGRSGRAR